MVRILVLSDSHGNVDSMAAAVRRTQPDQLIHLGDCWRDAAALGRLFPGIPLCRVPGNCDLFDLQARSPAELCLSFAGHRLFLCHGDRYGVKSSLLSLAYAALEQGAEAALFGHTHTPLLERREGLLLLNPGSIRGPVRHGFAVMEIEGARLDCALLTLEN